MSPRCRQQSGRITDLIANGPSSGTFPPFQDSLSQTIRSLYLVLPASLVVLSLLQSIAVRALACSSPRASAWFAGLLLGNHHLLFLPLAVIFAVVATGLVGLLLAIQRAALALGARSLDLMDKKGALMKLASCVHAPFVRLEIYSADGRDDLLGFL